MAMKKMKPAVKKRWVKALRSGEYTQGKNSLVWSGVADKDGKSTDRFCCLGVLCEIDKDVERAGDCYVGPKGWSMSTMPHEKLASDNWGLEPSAAERLATHNDNGKSFNWIASYIERYL